MTTDAAAQLSPWEPPFAGEEAEQLVGHLDRMRTTFRWKADGLDSAGLNHTVGASTLTLGALLKHLAVTEDFKSLVRLAGADMDPTWEENGWDDDDDWELTSAAEDSPEQLYRFFDDAVARSRARFAEALSAGGPGAPAYATGPAGEPVSIRRVLLDLVEEYARHTGHADLLRESLDGQTGEDPPTDWRPVSGHYAFR